ncbi:porin [Vibrio tritonius]|uniref:porin n=1 Tax=Vibrio tritonius TaxID=1435069 RepID=UPI000839AF84|nr:porin [Vibrio tritonius]
MKKTIISLAVAAAAVATGANAAEVYNADGTSVALGGRVEARLQLQDGEANDLTRARFNFVGKQQVNESLYGLAKFETEWSSHNDNGAADDSDTDLDTRYIFAGIGTDAGEITYGKQDGALVKLTNFTDIMSTWGKEASVNSAATNSDYYISLANRTDNYVAYNAQFDTLGVSAGYRFADGGDSGDNDSRVGNDQDGYALALTYGFGDTGVVIGAGYADQNSNDQTILTTSFTYEDLYLAALYTHIDYDASSVDNYDGYELAAAYTIDKTKLIATYNDGDWDDEGDTAQTLSVEANYFFTPSFTGYVGYRWNLLDGDDVTDNVDAQDQAMAGLLYTF